MSSVFIAQRSFEPSHPNTLAVYCSDGRFTQAVEELAQHLGHARVDTLTLPGGPALFNLATAGYCDSDTAGRAATFLIRGHHIREVLLLAHAGCGYYRARYSSHSDEAIRTLQLEDLRAAQQHVRLAHIGITVRAFYVSVEGRRIQFDAVTEANHPPSRA